MTTRFLFLDQLPSTTHDKIIANHHRGSSKQTDAGSRDDQREAAAARDAHAA